MTTNEIDRGGRPRIFDEDELIARIRSADDFRLIEAALLEYCSNRGWARGCVNWLWRRYNGDPSGGVHRKSATRYRGMLAELPHDPLHPPGGRRRVLREAAQRGGADLTLVAAGALAGVAVLAVFGPSEAARAILVLAADNARVGRSAPGRGDSGPESGPLRLVGAGGAGECVPGARCASPPTRVGCTSFALVKEAA